MTSAQETNKSTTAAKHEVVFDLLQRKVRKVLKPKERFCILLFKEFALTSVHDNVEPIPTNPPTHNYAFVLRGIATPWKQPIVNFLLRPNQRNDEQLSQIIKDTIKNVLKTGLTIVATVSTHDKVYRDAIEILRKESLAFLKGTGKFMSDYDETYVIECNIIHHVYDTCRLIRSFRNQLKGKDLIYDMDGKKRIAAWKSILRIFAVDKAKPNNSQRLKSLNINHLYTKNNTDLMITEHAVQIFSESVGNEILRSIETGDCMPSMEDTGKLTLFIDKLFDSCNADTEYAKKGKLYRNPIKSGSVHFKVWDEAMEILDSMRFSDHETGLVYRPACIDKWACTIQSFKNIWKTVYKAKIKTLDTRKFNLDIIINMMQVLRLLNQKMTQIYCESSEGDFLDTDILKLVFATGYGYYEIEDLAD